MRICTLIRIDAYRQNMALGHLLHTHTQTESEFGTPLKMFRRKDPGHHFGCDDDELTLTLGRASQHLGGLYVKYGRVICDALHRGLPSSARHLRGLMCNREEGIILSR